MIYPHVVNEFETLDQILSGKSISRFGDGEIKLIRGGNCVSQKKNPELAIELANILTGANPFCLTAIPNIYTNTPKAWFWDKYKNEKYVQLYSPSKTYHSSFITRPDSAPWINTQEYWDKVRQIWAGKKILLVTGGRSSALRDDTMPEAKSVTMIPSKETDAYDDIDRTYTHIRTMADDFDRVLLCLGATATCLAWRLSLAGIHALDMGHIAVYYRRWLAGEPMEKDQK